MMSLHAISFALEVERFTEGGQRAPFSRDLKVRSPQYARRFMTLERERSAIASALASLPIGAFLPALTRRIRALLRAEATIILDCFWQDDGGESGL